MQIKLNTKVYPLETILNTCYTFIDRAYIFLDSDSRKETIVVSLKGKKKLSAKKLEELKGEFLNELLYSCLRYKISRNNKKVREYIIGRALYSDLSSSDSDLLSLGGKSDYQEDPLGIAIPWEEKYGKNKRNAKSKV